LLGALKQLEELDFGYGSTIGGEVLPYLSDLAQLRRLHLHFGAPVTDEQLAHIIGLTKLEEFRFDPREVTDRGVDYLSRLHNLQRLDLAGSQMTALGLEYLTNLKRLKWLGLPFRIELTDELLAYIGQLPELEQLTAQLGTYPTVCLSHLAHY